MPTTQDYHIAIIGAGAAGLATAIFAAEAAQREGRTSRIVLLDGAKVIGAKILVAGGGRCNVTHFQVDQRDYFGPTNIIKNILKSFTVAQTTSWFAGMGVELKREETGKLFPVTDSARTVVDALLKRVRELNIDLFTEHRVRDVRPVDDHFEIDFIQDTLTADRVVLATGGKSLPRTGSDGTGWSIARRLGHSVTSTHEALVPLVLHEDFFHVELSGIAQDVTLSTYIDDKKVDERSGALLWTHFGVSGPVVMDASRVWVTAADNGKHPVMRVNLLPTMSFDQVEAAMVRVGQTETKRMVGTFLKEKFPERVAAALCEHAGIDPTETLSQLPRERRRELVHTLVNLELPIVGPRGWNYAEVTAGGIPMEEVDRKTMQSRLVPGLYLVGEILDVEGRIGGFNFQWAWSTGHLAGAALGEMGG